jgi:hypothetical protein
MFRPITSAALCDLNFYLLPARRSLVSPTVLKRSSHPSGRRSLWAETKSFIVPFGCAFFHFEYKWWTYIPPTHPPKIPRKVWCFICPCDTTQHRAFETTFCVGWLMSCKQTNRGHEGSQKLRRTSRREPPHLLFLSTRLDLRRRPHKDAGLALADMVDRASARAS